MESPTSEIDSLFFDKNPSPMVVFDLDTLDILKVNGAAVQKYGYTEKEFEDLNLKDIHTEEEIPILIKHLEGISKELQNPYHQHKKKNGDIFYAQVVSRNFVWNDTEVQMAVIHDVSREVESYKQLEEAKKQLNRAQSMAKIGSWEMSFDDMQLHWSDQMYKIFGLSKEKDNLSFEKLLEHIPEEEHSEFTQYIEDAKAGKIDGKGFEHRIITVDGEIRHVIERGEVDYNEGGKAVKMSGTMQDITRRKKNEKRIEDSLKEKNVLLAEIHHRVKNNLAVISGFLELQLFDEENKRVRHALKDNQNRIVSMAKIHELLYQSGEFTNISFNDYIRQIVDHLSSSHQAGNISFEIQSEIDVTKLNIDQAIPCALIVNEVVSNAIEHAFTEQDKGRIIIKLQKYEGKIKIVIQDNGVGMPEGVSLEDNNSSSLGFKLISILTQQLDGHSNYSQNVERGSRFELSFKPRKE